MSDIGDLEKWSKSAAKIGKSWEKITKSTEKTADGVAGTVGAVLGMPDRINGERQERRGYGNAMEGRANQAEIYRRQTEEQLRGYQQRDESRQEHGAAPQSQGQSGVSTEQGGAVVDADRYAQAGPAERAPRSPEQLRSDFVNAIAHATQTRSLDSLELAREIGEQLRNPQTGRIEIPVGREVIDREAIPGHRGQLPAIKFSEFNSKYDSVDQAIQHLSRECSKSRAIDKPPLDLGAPPPSFRRMSYTPDQQPVTLPTAPAEDQKAVYADFIRKVAKSEKTGEPLEVAGLPVNKEGLVVFPAGKYATGQLDDKGKPVVIEIKGTEEERSVDQMQALNFAKARVKEAGIGVAAAAPAAPAPEKTEPAPDATPRSIPTAAPAPDAPAAPAAQTDTKPMELPQAAPTAPKAKSYNVPSQQMPDGLKQNQVEALQTMLENAGATTGDTASDGKYGPKTHRALQEACERAGVKLKDVKFNDLQDPELVKLMAKLNEEATARANPGRQAEAPAAAPAVPSATEVAAQRAAQQDASDVPAAAAPAAPVAAAADAAPTVLVAGNAGLTGVTFGDMSQVQPNLLTLGGGLMTPPAADLTLSQLSQTGGLNRDDYVLDGRGSGIDYAIGKPKSETPASTAPGIVADVAPVTLPPSVLNPGAESTVAAPGSFSAGQTIGATNALFSESSFSFGGGAPAATFEQAPAAPVVQPAVLQQSTPDPMQAALVQAKGAVDWPPGVSGGQDASGIQAGTVGGTKREAGGVTV
jgi:hypothetical protein